MFRTSKRARTGIWMVLLLVIGLILLVACGDPDPTPTPQMIVVTATQTPTIVVQVVTATYTPTPVVVATDTPQPTDVPPSTEPPAPSDTPPPQPTDTPVPPPTEPPPPPAEEVKYFRYDHLSGAFSVDVPVTADHEDDEDGLYFTYEDSLVMIFYTVLDAVLSGDDMEDLVPVVIDSALVGEGLITSYDELDIWFSDDGRVCYSAFGASSDEYPDGDGSLVMWGVDRTLFMMILLTPDYDGMAEVWETMLNSMSSWNVAPEEPPAPQPNPTATLKPKPTATTKSPPTATTKPKPTATTKPAAPPPAKKGCYLIENQLGVDLTMTFTARDWQWAETISIPANQSKEYCLDPGRYTYTIDAPPPWGSTNGELVVNAGDAFRWPIRGG